MQNYILINKFSGFELDKVQASSQSQAAEMLYAKHPGTESKTDVVKASDHYVDLVDSADAEPDTL